jgi:hypothetical protein
MSRHLDNLKRLWKKLQSRYGSDDPVVLEMQREIEVIEARNKHGSVPYGEFLRAQTDVRLERRMGGRLTV